MSLQLILTARSMGSEAPSEVLSVLPPNVSAMRCFWEGTSRGSIVEHPGMPSPRPRVRLRTFNSIKEVQLKKVDRGCRRDSEGWARRCSSLSRTTSTASILSILSQAPSSHAGAEQLPHCTPGLADLDEHLLSKVLHMATAPQRVGVGGAAVVVRQWTNFALVCTTWRRHMQAQPLAIHVGLRQWPAVRQWLSQTHAPLASLHLTATDGQAAQQLQTLMCSPHFQATSGRYLATVSMGFGFRFAAPPGAWPALQTLGDIIGFPRHPLPATLTKLTLWAPPPFSSQTPQPPPRLGPVLRHLTSLKALWLGGWRLSHADLPPHLQVLRLQDCATEEDISTWPPPLQKVLEAGAAPRANTPREPFLLVGGARAGAAASSHVMVVDPSCDRRLLTAFLRPPLRQLS